MISVQSEDFSLEQEHQKLRTEAGDVGAIVTFTGIVRELYEGTGDNSGAAKTDTLYLEHYPGMTETSLANIVSAAHRIFEVSTRVDLHTILRKCNQGENDCYKRKCIL